MKKKKIAIICSSRAAYGYKRKIIKVIQGSEKLEPQLIVTGVHLLKEYGYSISKIEEDGYPIAAKVDMIIGGDTPASWAKSIGVEIESLAQTFSILKPDIVLIAGDRAEMFGAAATAVYMNIPVAHIQAGDVSGHIDGSVRHAITKLVHIHFSTCDDSTKRLERLGEEPWRIFNVGAPQLDEIIHGTRLPKEELEKTLNINLDQPTILVIQHPVLVENNEAYEQMEETMAAISELKIQSLIFYPSADAGGREIISSIKKHEKLPFIHTFQNIERQKFISLLDVVSVIVGNSSCGILEAPSFKLPAISIGTRQRNRMCANNVINVEHNRRLIVESIKKALYDKEFKKDIENCKNPYGDGYSSERIVGILEDLEINDKILDKKITY